MTKLFIANPTRQNHDIFFRIPEVRQDQIRTVPAGGQIEITHGDGLTEGQINGILKQLEPFGVVHSRESSKKTALKFSLFYQLNSPVDIEKIRLGIEKNADLALKMSDEARINSVESNLDSIAKLNQKEPEGMKVIVSEVEGNATNRTSKKKVVREIVSGKSA